MAHEKIERYTTATMATLIANSLLEYLKLIKEETDSIQYEKDYFLVLFRGQPTDDPLLPKIARDLKWDREFPTPRRFEFRELEKFMLQEFKRWANPYLENKPKTNWDWLIHAQHHGMATRLLDWTENPLTALFFAVQNLKQHAEPVVWIMKIKGEEIIIPKASLDPFNQKTTKVVRPNFISKRLEAQRGWFSVHKYLDNKNYFVPLEKNRSFNGQLIKLSIARKDASSILEDLSLCGINSATLFPDLDGISTYLNWKQLVAKYIRIRMPQAKKNENTSAKNKIDIRSILPSTKHP